MSLTVDGVLLFPVGRVQRAWARFPRLWHDRRHRLAGGDRRLYEYNKERLPNPYLAAMERDSRDLEAAKGHTGLSIGYPAWNLLYYAVLTHLNVRNRKVVILETGTNKGFSTIVLAQALRDSGRDGVVHTIELQTDLVTEAQQHVRQAGLSDLVQFHTGDSLVVLRRLMKTEPYVDFAFLDGCHLSRYVRREFMLLYPRLVPCRGKVYFDNVTSPEVSRAVRWIKLIYGGNVIEFMNCSWGHAGQAIWQAT